MSADDYAIREARVDERLTLMTFLQQHFFPHEYLLTTYLRINKYRIDQLEDRIIREDMNVRHVAMIENLPCLVAVHQETNEIVGINLMLVEENPALVAPTGSKEKSFAEIINLVPQQSKLLANWFTHVLEAADKTVDFFAEFPSLRATLKLIIVCVDPKHSGHGLATRLIGEAVKYAQTKDIGLVCGLFTSPFSRKAAEKNGLRNFNDVSIESLHDEEGNVIYEGTEPYVISVMAKLCDE